MYSRKTIDYLIFMSFVCVPLKKIKDLGNKSTWRAQTSLAKAAHYPHIGQIPDLESQHGSPDHDRNLITCSFYHLGPFRRISLQSGFFSVILLTDRKTDKQTSQRYRKQPPCQGSNKCMYVINISP